MGEFDNLFTGSFTMRDLLSQRVIKNVYMELDKISINVINDISRGKRDKKFTEVIPNKDNEWISFNGIL